MSKDLLIDWSYTGIISDLEEKLKKVTQELQDAISKLKDTDKKQSQLGLWLTIINIKQL